jgi:hypothetical protein
MLLVTLIVASAAVSPRSNSRRRHGRQRRR